MKVNLLKSYKSIGLTIITCMLFTANTGTAQEYATDLVPDNFIRFHMWDGSIVAGLVTMDAISIETEFGVLEVPVSKI